MTPYIETDSDSPDRDHLEHGASGRADGVWIRWVTPIILGLAVSAFVAVMAIRDTVSDLRNKISIIEVKEEIGAAQRVDLVNNIREQGTLVGQLKETIVRLTLKVDELLEDRHPPTLRRAPVFPDQRSGQFDK